MNTSRLPQSIIDKTFQKIETLYSKELGKLVVLSGHKKSGGKIRQRKGDLVVSILELIFKALIDFYGSNKEVVIDIKRGEKDKQTLNSKNGYYEHSQDLHLYINNRFVMSIELKSYTESAMYKRVCEDARLIKKYVDKNIKCILIELENARKDKSQAFMDEEYGTISEIFTLVHGRRSSAKALHIKKFYKPLDKDAVSRLMIYLDNFILDNLSKSK